MKKKIIIPMAFVWLFLFTSSSLWASFEKDELVFGSLVGWGDEELMKESGIKIVGMVGSWIFGWDVIMPDGIHIDKEAIAKVDKHIKNAHRNGMDILFRLRTGGNSTFSFSAIPQKADFPVDLTNYPEDGPSGGYKNGEYIGAQIEDFPACLETNYPPKILTDDSPGNTSPWYDFCYAIASRYNGKTPDPAAPGEYLPEIEYFSTTGEMDTKHYWYGTATDYYGRPDEKGTMIGLLPTIYRAVKAANPNAKIVDGGFLSENVGYHILYDMALQEGGVTQKVVDYNDRYFKNNFMATLPDANYLQAHLNSPIQIRARQFFNKAMEAHQFWDIFCFHSYLDYLMHDTISFIKKKMAEQGLDRPIWGREMGIPNFPFFPQPEITIASRLLKKFVSSFGAGAQVCTVTPFTSQLNPAANFIPGPGLYKADLQLYQFFNPSASLEQIKENVGTLMLDTFELLSKSLSNCTVEDYALNGDAYIYIFSSPSEGKKVVIGWTDNINDQLFPGNYLDPWNYQTLTVYNHIGEIQAPIIPMTLNNDPFVIVLENDGASNYTTPETIHFPPAPSSSGGGGCSNIRAFNTPFLKNGLVNMLVWLSPALYILWRRSLITRHLD